MANQPETDQPFPPRRAAGKRVDETATADRHPEPSTTRTAERPAARVASERPAGSASSTGSGPGSERPEPARRPAAPAPQSQQTPPSGQQEAPAAGTPSGGPGSTPPARDGAATRSGAGKTTPRSTVTKNARDDRTQGDRKQDDRKKGAARGSSGAGVLAAVDKARLGLAQVVRVVCILLALVLAVGALLVAVRDNVSADNPLVTLIWDVADAVDGPFSRDNGVFVFDGKNAETKDAVVNWGIAAIVYLVIGNLVQRLIRPRSSARK